MNERVRRGGLDNLRPTTGVPRERLRTHPQNLIRFVPAKGDLELERLATEDAVAGGAGLCPPGAKAADIP
jgi:hypothetical protein